MAVLLPWIWDWRSQITWLSQHSLQPLPLQWRHESLAVHLNWTENCSKPYTCFVLCSLPQDRVDFLLYCPVILTIFTLVLWSTGNRDTYYPLYCLVIVTISVYARIVTGLIIIVGISSSSSIIQMLTERLVSRWVLSSSQYQLYSGIIYFRADPLRSNVCDSEWVTSFKAHFFSIHRRGVLTALFGCYIAGAAWSCCRLGADYVNTIPCTLQCHFFRSHRYRVHACLAVTCHLHVWQNDRGLSRATAVTQGWNGYWNKSQHIKLTMEKKILPPVLSGIEPATFWSWVRRSTTELSPILY